jgi:hypothetical protein
MLMGVDLIRQMAANYRQQSVKFVTKLWAGHSDETSSKDIQALSNEQDGTGFEIIQRSGHHLQNHLHWEECPRKIMLFLDGL